MKKINFENLPSTNTPINATNLNLMQSNVEEALSGVEPMGDIVVSDIKCKNYFNMNNLSLESYISFIDGVIAVNNYANGSLQNLKEIAPDLKAGETYMLNFKTTGSSKYIYLDGSNSVWFMGEQHTITQEELDSYIIVYGEEESSETVYISEIQIEKSLEPTAYTSYKGFGYESGTTDGWDWVKYDDGRLEQHKTLTVNATFELEKKWGVMWESYAISLGNFAIPFIEKPKCQISNQSGSGGCIETFQGTTNVYCGETYMCRPIETEGTLSYLLTISAFGKWK